MQKRADRREHFANAASNSDSKHFLENKHHKQIARYLFHDFGLLNFVDKLIPENIIC